jgi:hypothetical protein
LSTSITAEDDPANSIMLAPSAESTLDVQDSANSTVPLAMTHLETCHVKPDIEVILHVRLALSDQMRACGSAPGRLCGIDYLPWATM